MVPYQVKKHPHCSTQLTQFFLVCPSFTSCPGKACCSQQAMHLHSSPHILFPQLKSPPIHCWYNCGGTFPDPCCGLGHPDSLSIPYYVLISPTGRVLCYYGCLPLPTLHLRKRWDPSRQKSSLNAHFLSVLGQPANPLKGLAYGRNAEMVEVK